MEAKALGEEPGTRVTVEVDWDVVQPSIEAEFLEDVDDAESGEELRAWRSGALLGARYALDVSNALPCRVRVTEIYGALDGTNATIVGAASAHAVWEAIGYRPSLQEAQVLDHEVAASIERPSVALPDFGA